MMYPMYFFQIFSRPLIVLSRTMNDSGIEMP